ncbi:MAG: FAD-dependent oxidoreductase [Lewinella sp.]|nr:FAD-dependent oxidoreductase [Lewinella sp.]
MEQPSQTDIAIIGGGLTGLTLHYFLREAGLSTVIIEARDRVGGRIQTTTAQNQPPVEMGATWLGKKHTHLVALLDELGLETFPQQLGERAIYEPVSTSPHQLVTLPANEEPSYRIRGGKTALIQALAAQVPADGLHFGQVVRKITGRPDGIEVVCAERTFTAKMVVSTLPPNLLLKTIAIEPALPPELLPIMAGTHTWMGESIKFGLVYRSPFWRADRLSGTLVSNVGPIPEMYDHANFEDDRYALKGFLHGAYHSLDREERLAIILRQLRKYYGPAVDDFVDYHEKAWLHDPFTYAPYDQHVLPHQHNGHTDYHEPYLDGKLFIAGSETARDFPGYMEGAVSSAQWVAAQIRRRVN